VEDKFLTAIGKRPYYRLFACPVQADQVKLHERIEAARQLVNDPPAMRPHGWDLKPFEDSRVTQTGVTGGRAGERVLRLLWNGYVEFQMPADDELFHWGESDRPDPVRNLLYPFALSEPAACFALLAKEVCQLAGYTALVRFGLGLYNIKGMYLLPYGPTTYGYMMARSRLNQACGPKPFTEEHIKTPTVDVRAGDLPGTVAWTLVSHVYYRFGYEDKEIPFFDDRHEPGFGS